MVLAIIAALASLTRYIGVTLIVTGVSAIILTRRSKPSSFVLRICMFVAISFTPLLVWFLRNYMLVGMPSGYRNPYQWMPVQNVLDASVKIADWFVPQSAPLIGLFWILIASGVLLTLLRSYRTSRTNGGYSTKPNDLFDLTVLIFLFVYLTAVIMTTETIDHADIHDDRMYIPVFVPLFMTFAFIIRTLLPVEFHKMPVRKFSWVLTFGFAIWLLYPGYSAARYTWRSLTRGWVPYYNIYATPLYQDSAIIKWLDEGVADSYDEIYSDHQFAYLSLRRPVLLSPRMKGRYREPIYIQEYCGIWPQSNDALLIWYEGKKDTAYTIEELELIANLDPLLTTENAGIYRVSRDCGETQE